MQDRKKKKNRPNQANSQQEELRNPGINVTWSTLLQQGICGLCWSREEKGAIQLRNVEGKRARSRRDRGRGEWAKIGE